MFRNFFRRLMSGRYGPDHLNAAIIILSLVFALLHIILRFMPLSYVSYTFFGVALFRMLSRNIFRRRAENDRFIRYWWPVRTKILRTFSRLKQRKTHKFIKCPVCRNTLRVPKRKGKIQITCPKCGERFIKKT